MLEIKLTVEATDLAIALNNLAAALGIKANPIAPSAPPPATAAAPASTPAANPASGTNYPAPGVPLAQPPKYTPEQIMSAGAALVDAGRVEDLMNLLNSFGVQSVLALKPEQLGAFATAMREMGAQI
jgi:hypothetical protein